MSLTAVRGEDALELKPRHCDDIGLALLDRLGLGKEKVLGMRLLFVGIFFLEKELMILRFCEMGFECAGNEIEELLQFIIRHSLNQCFHQGVIRKHLQIADHRILIMLPV